MKQSYFNYNLKTNFDNENYFVSKSNSDAFNMLINHKTYLDNFFC